MLKTHTQGVIKKIGQYRGLNMKSKILPTDTIDEILSKLEKGDIIGQWKVNGIFPRLKTIEVVDKDENFSRDNWNYGVFMEKQIMDWVKLIID